MKHTLFISPENNEMRISLILSTSTFFGIVMAMSTVHYALLTFSIIFGKIKSIINSQIGSPSHCIIFDYGNSMKLSFTLCTSRPLHAIKLWKLNVWHWSHISWRYIIYTRFQNVDLYIFAAICSTYPLFTIDRTWQKSPPNDNIFPIIS